MPGSEGLLLKVRDTQTTEDRSAPSLRVMQAGGCSARRVDVTGGQVRLPSLGSDGHFSGREASFSPPFLLDLKYRP